MSGRHTRLDTDGSQGCHLEVVSVLLLIAAQVGNGGTTQTLTTEVKSE